MRFGGILVGLSALMLSGCFDMKQDFEFRGDGTAKATIRMAVDAKLIAMADGDSKEPFCSDGMLQKVEKDGMKSSAQRTTEGGDVVCIITLDGKTDALVAAMASGELMPGDDNAEAQQKMGISLTREGDRHVLLISAPPMGKEEDPSTAGMQQMFLAAMAGRSLAWTVSAPEIVETTGTRSDDGTVASFSIPLAEAFSNTTKTYEFRTVFVTEEPGFMGWLKSFF